MPVLTHLLLLATAVACGCATIGSDGTPGGPGQARLDIDRGETTSVRALFDGVSTEALTYRLEVFREGPAGRSQSTQGGAFESAAGRTDTLSTVQVSATPGDRFEARLTVQREGVTVSETHIEETVR